MTDPVMENVSSPGASKGSDRTLSLYVLAALGLAIVIRFFIAAPYVVAGSSMENTFENLDYLIVDRISYDLGEPQRGDVIVLDLPEQTSRALIKRIVGLPGETVELSGTKPIVTIFDKGHPKGFALDESYIASDHFGGASDLKVTLGPDQYFVLGDNRRVSADSRLWGVLPRRDIVGRVLVRLYPFDRMGVLPGEARYAQ